MRNPTYRLRDDVDRLALLPCALCLTYSLRYCTEKDEVSCYKSGDAPANSRSPRRTTQPSTLRKRLRRL